MPLTRCGEIARGVDPPASATRNRPRCAMAAAATPRMSSAASAARGEGSGAIWRGRASPIVVHAACADRARMLGERPDMGAFEELSWRGLVQQTTAENFAEVLDTPLTMYVGHY